MPNNGNSDSREVSASRDGSSSITHRRLDAPSTPGRPIFSFNSVGKFSRKSFPSKWDDAEKWLISSHHSPPHAIKLSEPSNIKVHPDSANFQGCASLDHHDIAHASDGISCSMHTVLKGAISILTSQLFPCFYAHHYHPVSLLLSLYNSQTSTIIILSKTCFKITLVWNYISCFFLMLPMLIGFVDISFQILF